jgi:hypothetical protein
MEQHLRQRTTCLDTVVGIYCFFLVKYLRLFHFSSCWSLVYSSSLNNQTPWPSYQPCIKQIIVEQVANGRKNFKKGTV